MTAAMSSWRGGLRVLQAGSRSKVFTDGDLKGGRAWAVKPGTALGQEWTCSILMD